METTNKKKVHKQASNRCCPFGFNAEKDDTYNNNINKGNKNIRKEENEMKYNYVLKLN